MRQDNREQTEQQGLAPLILVIILALACLLLMVGVVSASMYIGYLGKGDPANLEGEDPASEFQAGEATTSQPEGCDLNWWGGVSSEIWGSLGQPDKNIVAAALGEINKCYDSDRVPYNNYQNHQWCAAFAVWCYNQAGHKVPLIESSQGLFRWFKRNGHHTHRDPSKAQPGEIVVWSRGGGLGHTGIVIANYTSEKLIKTIEGNLKGNCVRIKSYTYQQILNHHKGLVGFAGW